MALRVHDKSTKSFNEVAFPVITNLAVAEGPYPTYWRSTRPTVTKTSVTIPAGVMVDINGKTYTKVTETVLDLSGISVTDRTAKDVYIYACEPTVGIEPVFVLSLNSTTPTGYNADNSRKIGGFHCLCVDVGTISGHTLSGYVAGDILPASIWDLLHRPKSEPEGMVYVEPIDRWVDIYLASYDGSQLRSIYGGTCADGTSTVKFHGEKFNEEFAKIKKHNIFRDHFVIAAWNSNKRTAIMGAADAGTTGGHVDTAGRRMISDWGVEDACGFMWQWNELIGAGDTSGWDNTPYTGYANGVYQSTVDPESYGDDHGSLFRLRAGGDWGDSSHCGPRAVTLSLVSSYVNADLGGRGASEPRTRFV